MKNLLNYFYHIYPDVLHKNGDGFYFFLDEKKYYLIKFDRNIEELDILVEITNLLYEKNIKVHTFIKTVNDNFFVSYAGNNYIVLRVNQNEKEELDLFDILNFNNSLIVDKNLLYENNWEYRWEEQIDDFERQVLEYNKEYPLLVNHFDYYIGLAENAVSYLKIIKNNSTDKNLLYLSHKRLNFPLHYEELYNPLNFMFDSKIRDMAEYIKSKIFSKSFDFVELKEYFKNTQFIFDLEDIGRFYARLLYPTYYFDFFEKVINDEIEEKEFSKYIEMSKEYEKFLKKIYIFLKRKYNIEPIDWIVNKR